ncbi:nonstructural protein [Chlamydia phage 3]|uniref:Nonstructural protein n=1 Tax=Chlamydia phage 3 TaxID=225067 RepID=Q6KF05_9VIRU|nr:nonstructural protein [Chlamydia phage 3]
MSKSLDIRRDLRSIAIRLRKLPASSDQMLQVL